MSVSEGVGVRKWETMTNVESFLKDLGFLEVREDYSSLRFFCFWQSQTLLANVLDIG